MIIFQKYMYTIVNAKHLNPLGVYPNFKRAYERLEEIAGKGMISDCTKLEKEDPNVVEFEVTRCYKNKFGYSFDTRKYAIVRSLLSLYDDDEYISSQKIYDIINNNKRECPRYVI